MHVDALNRRKVSKCFGQSGHHTVTMLPRCFFPRSRQRLTIKNLPCDHFQKKKKQRLPGERKKSDLAEAPTTPSFLFVSVKEKNKTTTTHKHTDSGHSAAVGKCLKWDKSSLRLAGVGPCWRCSGCGRLSLFLLRESSHRSCVPDSRWLAAGSGSKKGDWRQAARSHGTATSGGGCSPRIN